MNKFTPALLLALCGLISPFTQSTELTVSDAWIREAPPVSKVHAAYMTIHNPTDKSVTLITASSPLYSNIEFHRTVMENGVMRMLQEESLRIPADAELRLEPEGIHMMLFNPGQPLKAGDKVPFTLNFSDQMNADITVIVKKATTNQRPHRCGQHE